MLQIHIAITLSLKTLLTLLYAYNARPHISQLNCFEDIEKCYRNLGAISENCILICDIYFKTIKINFNCRFGNHTL